MIGLDLQESPPLSSCFVLRVKSGESDGGSIWERRGGGRGGSWEQHSKGKTSRGLLLILAPTMLTIKMCAWERDTESEKENWGLNISTQSSQQRHFHSRWSGSAAIWRPWWPDNPRYLQTPKLCLDKPSKSHVMAKKNVRLTFVFNHRDLGKGKVTLNFPKTTKRILLLGISK